MSLDNRTCQFFVTRKNRNCRMLVKKGQVYCGEHLVHDESNTSRISCPLNPNHSTTVSELKSHLKRCTSRLKEDPWIEKNFNVLSTTITRELIKPSEDQIFEIIQVIRRIYPQIENQFKELNHRHFYDDTIVPNSKNSDCLGEKKTGQLIQLGSIIDHLQFHNLLKNSSDSCLIDLGSGKAQLIYWLAKKARNCRYLLIDRMGARSKHDNKALIEDPKLQIKRLKCSIEHLILSKVPIIEECKSSLTVVCKHFCGNAIDTGIRCVENAIKQGVDFNGFTFASCCHHRCTRTEYVGLDYFKLIGIETEEQFSTIRYMTTWATCDFIKPDSIDQSIQNSEKLELGRMAKRLFEYGRAQYLSSLGYKVEIFKYVDFEVTPENLLIVGYKKD